MSLLGKTNRENRFARRTLISFDSPHLFPIIRTKGTREAEVEVEV
jgi:hypothetical protein